MAKRCQGTGTCIRCKRQTNPTSPKAMKASNTRSKATSQLPRSGTDSLKNRKEAPQIAESDTNSIAV
jgi:hypothetical protein